MFLKNMYIKYTYVLKKICILNIYMFLKTMIKYSNSFYILESYGKRRSSLKK